MSSGNRTVKYENLLKALRKHYKPLADPPERSVLEHLLYACCLEDARVEQADEGFAKLQQTYFDWNEVRVTTVAELAEALKALPFPMQAASRIKQCLQSIFETRYQYDIDDMKKANLGKATAELEAWKGMSPFAVAYVSQHALGGHSIPPSSLICDAMWQCEILTLQEIPKNALPGIERAIPKTKGIEFAGLMHQFATDLYHHPKSAAPLAVLKDMGASYKSKPKPIEEPKESKSKGSAAKQSPAKSTPPEKAPALKAPAESAKEPASKPTTVPAPKVAPSAVASAKSSSGQKTEKTEKVEPAKTASKQEVKAAKPPSKPLAAHVSKAIGKPAKASESVQGSGKSAASKPAGDKPTSEKSANGKPANGKPASGKPASGKPANGKPASSKPANGKPASGKSASPKPSSGKPVVSSKSADSKSADSKSSGSKPSGSKPASSKPEKSPKPEKSSKPGKAAADQGKSDKGKIDKGKMDPSKGSKKDVKDSGKSSSKGNQGSVGSSLTKKKPK
jgi:hypothetical protein